MGLILFVLGCAAMGTLQEREKIYGKALPVIIQSFAAKEIRTGDTWKVYLNASDPDGDMKNIFCVLQQTGLGVYPVGITRIKEGDRRELSGYLYLNTPDPSNALNFAELTLTVQIQDRAGHFSEPAIFPLSLQSRSTQKAPPSEVFQEQDLGPVMIQMRPRSLGKGE
jgi:hypothetical protein